MRFVFGLTSIIFGIYFLTKNIFFTTRHLLFWHQDLSATGAVILVTLGIMALIFIDEKISKIGWVLIALAIVLIFKTSRVFLKPTSLWTFIVGISAMGIGFKMIMSKDD